MNASFLLIIFLIFVICMLLWQQQINIRKQLIQEQNDKVLQALLAYPVHEYQIEHMLERCLAIIFSIPRLKISKKGAVFLANHEHINLQVQIGLSERAWQKNQSLCRQVIETKMFQYIPCVDEQLHSLGFTENDGHGLYIVPLLSSDKLLGVMNLYVEENHFSNREEELFLKSVGHTVAGLIERKLISDELRLGNSVITHSQQAIFITDKNNHIIRANQACEKITGYSSSELLGKNPNIFQSEQQDSDFYKQLWDSIDSKGFWQGEIWNRKKDGNVFPEWLTISAIKNKAGEINQHLAIFTDLTNVWQAEQNINKLSFFDLLTGLPNQTLYIDRVNQAISQANRQQHQLAILYFQIDEFKAIIDNLGDQQGDDLIKGIAFRMTETMRLEDTVGRVGIDEFSVLINDVSGESDSKTYHIAEKILNNISESFFLDGDEIYLSASIGICCYPGDAYNAIDLIKYAESAMHLAKQSGQNSIRFYRENINQIILQKMEVESALRQAIKQETLEIYFQPQVKTETNQISGAEALLRWDDSILGNIPPAKFIPIAEDSGLIVNLGAWVFLEVCNKIKFWSETGVFSADFNRVAINVSLIQFNHYKFVEMIEQTLASTQVPVQYLEIELTESTLQKCTDSVIEKLMAIKALGINIAIDGFGTGYSSLSRLKQLPIDVIKIDRSFVQDIGINTNDQAIVKAILAMSDALGLSVLAVGIEFEEQLVSFSQLHCQFYQGYLFSKAVESSAFEALLMNEQETNNKNSYARFG